MGFNIQGGIREARKKCGYTQADIARIFKLSKETVSNYETGRTQS